MHVNRASAFDRIQAHLEPLNGTVARLARSLTDRARSLTTQIDQLAAEISELVTRLAPSLLAIPGCAALTAAKILGETAGAQRFHSKHAYARHNGTAPLPVWSSNKTRHRLARSGNRQLNAALHRIALTQAHWHPDARALLDRRKKARDDGMEARVLKRRLSDVVYKAMINDVRHQDQLAA